MIYKHKSWLCVRKFGTAWFKSFGLKVGELTWRSLRLHISQLWVRKNLIQTLGPQIGNCISYNFCRTAGKLTSLAGITWWIAGMEKRSPESIDELPDKDWGLPESWIGRPAIRRTADCFAGEGVQGAGREAPFAGIDTASSGESKPF